MALSPVTVSYANNTRTVKVGEPTYVGRVLNISSKEERIMSDVWDIVSYATVLEDDGSTKVICLGGREFGWHFDAKVDADPAVLAAWQAEQEAKRLAAEAAYREQKRIENAARLERDAETSLKAPLKGRHVRVVKGRKVPVGTEGTVVWAGFGDYGSRVGIKDAAGTVHYTAASNAEAVVNKPEDMTWREYYLLLENARWALENTRPLVGGGATVVATGQMGICFFARGDRFGIALTNRKVNGCYADVVWASLGEVVRVDTRVTLPEGDTTPAVNKADVVVPF